jgi:hypothetical protein
VKIHARTVHHDLPPERAREVIEAMALRLGFAREEGDLALRRGTWLGQLMGMNPRRLRARLRVDVLPGEARLELGVTQMGNIFLPQDQRYFEAELDALEAALHGREPETRPAELEREASIASCAIVTLIVAVAVASAVAHALGLTWRTAW